MLFIIGGEDKKKDAALTNGGFEAKNKFQGITEKELLPGGRLSVLLKYVAAPTD